MENKNNEQKEPKLKEASGILISTSIKIFDPNSKEVHLHVRGDK